MDTRRLILYLVAIVVIVPMIFALGVHLSTPRFKPAPIGTVNGPSVNVSNSFGGGNVQVFASVCAGKVSLTQGSATVNDACFTGDTNIVICSDITSVNAARCEPGKGSLTVEGHANDTIAFARMK